MIASLVLARLAHGQSVEAHLVDGKLSVHARESSAPEIFSAVTKASGIRFVIDPDVKLGTLDVDIDGMNVERAIRTLIAQIPDVAGSALSFVRGPEGLPRLDEVSLFGAGKVSSGAAPSVAPASPVDSGLGSLLPGRRNGATAETPAAPPPTPSLEERRFRLIQAGLPEETADDVASINEEVGMLQTNVHTGMGDRAARMQSLQERYRRTMKKLSELPEGTKLPDTLAPLPTDE